MNTEDLDQIQARADVVRRCYQAAPNDCYDMGDIDKAVEAQLGDVPALLARVRSQQAQIERVEALIEKPFSSADKRHYKDDYNRGHVAGYNAAAGLLRAALTATEGAA